MLKQEFDILYSKINTWLFGAYIQFSNDKAYGSLKPIGINKVEVFMQMEFLQFIHNVNKLRNPGHVLRIPSCINVDDFNRIVSNLKNQLL